MLNKYLLLLVSLVTANQLTHAKIISYSFLHAGANSYIQDVSEHQEALFRCLIEARQEYAAWKDHKKGLEARTEELNKEDIKNSSFNALKETDIFWHAHLLALKEKQLNDTISKCSDLQKKVQETKSN